jgi:DNA polymerase-3 subunit delta
MKRISVNSFSSYFNHTLEESLFVIYGEERYFFNMLLEKIEDAVFKNKADKDLNYHVFYGTESSISDILSACLSFPMLADHKLVVIKEFDKLPVFDKDSFLKYISNPQPSTILVLIADKFGGNKFYNDILNQAVSVNCKNLSNGEVYQWSVERFKAAEIKSNKESIAFLIENIGPNLSRLDLEIEKIINFLGSDQLLTIEIVSQITGFAREVNIFNFQKVLAVKDLKTGLKIGYHLLEQGQSMAAILPMVFIFFRRVWIVKQLINRNNSQNEILEMLGGTSYSYRDIFASHGNFSYQHLELIFEKLLEAELQLKTSQKSPESILTILSYFICNFANN